MKHDVFLPLVGAGRRIFRHFDILKVLNINLFIVKIHAHMFLQLRRDLFHSSIKRTFSVKV